VRHAICVHPGHDLSQYFSTYCRSVRLAVIP
jgi:hypothetical protein